MKKILILVILLAPAMFSGSLHAQKKLTLEDVISGGKNFYKYLPERFNVGFRATSDELVFISNDMLYSKKVRKTESELLIVLKDLNRKIEEAGGEPLKYWPHLNWISYNEIWFRSKNKFLKYNFKTAKVEVLASYDKEGKLEDFCYEGKRVAYVTGHDLYVSSGQGTVPVAKAEKEGITYGQSVHRNEFGITKGTFWSPKGNYLAFYRNDQSMVTDYPLVNIETRIATVKNIKYPMAGMTSEEVSVCIFNVHTGDTLHLKTASPVNRYFTNIAWTPDEKYLLVAELNREQNHMQLNKYDVSTGEKVSTLFEERDEQWVEPLHPALFVPGSDNLFVWQSMRDGHNHLYLYDTGGNLVRELTTGDMEVISVTGFDGKAKNLYFIGTSGDALNRYPYVVTISNAKVKQLVSTEGNHIIKVSNSGLLFIDFYTSLNVPYKVDLRYKTGKVIDELFIANDPFKDIKVGQVKLLKVKAADGKTDLNARIVLPPDFDPSKKYPVIVYVYGGPHSQLVRNIWRGAASGWQTYMAQKGYIVFTLDNRGTQYRGEEFEQVIHRHLGKNEVADQMKGVDYLKSLPYVDSTRIGVHGWSFGGFMTTSLMLQHPETFKVGVAGGPVIDWKYYEVMYGERYMDTPQENPEGYAEANLNKQVKNLKGHLLVIHGAQDPTVVWQHSLSFVRSCVENGIQLDYFVYPSHEHNVLGHDRVHLMRKVTRYFEDFL